MEKGKPSGGHSAETTKGRTEVVLVMRVRHEGPALGPPVGLHSDRQWEALRGVEHGGKRVGFA